MTEDEARTKWCPFARVLSSLSNGHVVIAAAAGNRANGLTGGGLNPSAARCIASDCMAWRWHDGGTSEGGRDLSRTFGRCGLAGGAADDPRGRQGCVLVRIPAVGAPHPHPRPESRCTGLETPSLRNAQ